jgi:hypothetical protein
MFVHRITSRLNKAIRPVEYFLRLFSPNCAKAFNHIKVVVYEPGGTTITID